jgi:hypothetical protein
MTAMSEDESTEDSTDEVDVTVSIDEHTVIDVTGERDLAVVVRSAEGEQIYLPPEDFEESPDRGTSYESAHEGASGAADSPYRPAESAQSPYQPADGRGQSPYDGVPEPTTTGVESTPTGVRIVHPEPISDLRLLR